MNHTIFVAQRANFTGGARVDFDTSQIRRLAAGSLVKALQIDCTLTLTATADSQSPGGGLRDNANIFQRVTWGAADSAGCGEAAENVVSGADLQSISHLAGYPDPALLLPQLWDDMDTDETSVRRLRFYLPFAWPSLAHDADRYALAAGDMPPRLTIQLASNAAIQTLLSAASVDLTDADFRLSAIVGRPPLDGIHIGRPVVYKRVEGITEASRQWERGQYLAAYLDFAAAQSEDNEIALSLPGSKCAGIGPVSYREAFGALDVWSGLLQDPIFDSPDVTAAGTMLAVPLVAHRVGVTLAELETTGLSYRLVTAATHDFISARAVRRPDGEDIAKADAARAHKIAVNESRSHQTARVLPQEPVATGAASLAHKAVNVALDPGMVAAATLNRAKGSQVGALELLP